MIAEINNATDFWGPVMYNMLKTKSNEAKIIDVNCIKENDNDIYSISDIKRGFDPYLNRNLRTKNIMMHISLNPDPRDVLSDYALTILAEEYMEKLGYGHQPYVVFKHTDIERQHLHIITTPIQSNGKRISSSNNYLKSKNITEELEEKYGLHKSSETSQKTYQPQKIDIAQKSIGKQTKAVLNHLYNSYTFSSIGELSAVLSTYNIDLITIKGEKNNSPYTGIVYAATDDLGRKIAPPIKASALGIKYTLKGIEKNFKTDKISQKTKDKIKEALLHSYSLSEFQNRLKKEHIDIVIRQSDKINQKIYGISYIDHNEKTVYNGSRIGKEFSAASLNAKFPDHANYQKPVIKNPESLQEQTAVTTKSTELSPYHSFPSGNEYAGTDFNETVIDTKSTDQESSQNSIIEYLESGKNESEVLEFPPYYPFPDWDEFTQEIEDTLSHISTGLIIRGDGSMEPDTPTQHLPSIKRKKKKKKKI